MKAKKIIITIIIVTGIAGCGIAGLRFLDSSPNAQSYQMMEQKVKVEKGDLDLNIVSTGKVVLANENSDNLNDLKVQIDVDQTDISKIKIGQLVNLKLDAFPDEIVKGTIYNISNIAEEGSTKYKVDITIEKSLFQIATINANDANLREGASVQYLVIKQLAKDTKVKIIETQNTWYKVALEDGTMGWISRINLKIDGLNRTDMEGTINNDTVNLTKLASSNSALITKLVKGNKVTILDKNNGYYKVKLSDGQEGWINENSIITEKIKPGMSLTATIDIDSKKDVLYLPINCLVKNEDGYFAILPGGVETKPVKVGISNEDYIEITDGLSVGDEVLIQN